MMACVDGLLDTLRFHYVYSCDLDISFKIKIGTLEGRRTKPSYRSLINDPLLKFSGISQDCCSDLYVTCQVYANGDPLALPVQTSYKAFSTRWNWNEWLTLPIKISDLPRNAVLAFTVWDVYGPRKNVPIGGTTVSIFGKRGALRQGMHDLRLWPDVEADAKQNTTPGKVDSSKEQMIGLSKLSKKHRNGHMIKVDWLDRLTFREIEMINEREKRSSDYMFLMIEFPRIVEDGTEFMVVYFEKDGDETCQYPSEGTFVVIPDSEILTENLVESKHHKLSRSIRSGLSDRDLKPNALVRDQLNTISLYPSTKVLTSEEQDLVWKFRFYLTSQKKALAKFLKCVNWNLAAEVKQALELLNCWQAMDVEDALELLSPQFTHPAVRRYAVTRLQQAPDEDLLLYLLQLVQALKYENFEEIKQGLETCREPIHQTDSAGSGLERERFNLLFLLSGGGKFNFQGSKKWIEDNIDSSEGSLLPDSLYTLCLDTIGTDDSLYLHVSKPPKEGSSGSFFFKELQKVANSLYPELKVNMVHKKINLAEEVLAWEHERFSIRRLPAFTLSRLHVPRLLTRTSILDTRDKVNVNKLARNVKVIAEAIAHHMYNLSADSKAEIFTDGLAVQKQFLAAWIDHLSSHSRSAQLLASISPRHPLVTTLEQTMSRYLKEVSLSIFKPDRREPEVVFYEPAIAVMNAYRVKPAVFDLFLALAIAAYLSVVYIVIMNFYRLESLLRQVATPVKSKQA